MNAEIDKLVGELGVDVALDVLRSRVKSSHRVLTIVADPTMHKIPESELLGQIFFFNKGSLDVSTGETLKEGLIFLLKRLNRKLQEGSWDKVRLVYSGHAVLAAQIKLLVYRVTHLETEDVAFFGAQGYRTVTISLRGEVIE